VGEVTFQTREDLEAWVAKRKRAAPHSFLFPNAYKKFCDETRRVTLSHHQKEE
jgi:hypothetical protein